MDSGSKVSTSLWNPLATARLHQPRSPLHSLHFPIEDRARRALSIDPAEDQVAQGSAVSFERLSRWLPNP
jgi:hypothetical protein